MPTPSHEIRLCTSCGLRYPLTDGHSFGTRCPSCMGTTRLLLSRNLNLETRHLRPGGLSHEIPSRRDHYAVLLDNIRSAWNVGSILRSADGFGFAHAYLCGITSTPEKEAVTKTSLGAEDSVTWSYHKDAVKLIKGLKKEGWRISALEDDNRAIAITSKIESSSKENASDQKSVLIVGNEIVGVDPGLLDLCERIFYIPMRGEKKSFNVAIAFSIAAFQMQKGEN